MADFLFAEAYAWFLGIVFVSLLAGALPLILHLGIALGFLLSKLFYPVLQKPTEIVLLRFYESKKGVLTIIATGLALLATVISKGAKYFLG